MAFMSGKNGKIIWDADDTDVGLSYAQNWTCTYTHEVAEITSMQDTWRTYYTGSQDWTATAECLLVATGTEIPIGSADGGLGMADDECMLELYFHHEVGVKFRAVYGNAICTGISITDPVDGIVTLTYSFQGIDHLKWYSSNTVEPGE